MQPSNFVFEVRSAQESTLAKALDITFDGGYATHWGEVVTEAGTRTLKFFWSDPGMTFTGEANKLLGKVTSVEAYPLVKAWLLQQTYGPQPDHDGSNSKGFYVCASRSSSNYVLVEISPEWAEFWK